MKTRFGNVLFETVKLLLSQIQLEGSQWSLPFAIDREETIHVVMRCNNGTRIFVRVDVRGYEDGSRYLVNFQLGSSRGPYR